MASKPPLDRRRRGFRFLQVTRSEEGSVSDYNPETAIETIGNNYAYIKSPKGPSLRCQIHRTGDGVRLEYWGLEYWGNGRFTLEDWGIDGALKLQLEKAVAKQL
jgi:hypothetical protein